MADQRSELPAPNRFITDHDDNGLAIFNTSIPEQMRPDVADNLSLHLAYATTSLPANYSDRSDIVAYSNFLDSPPGIFLAEGSVVRIVDMQPGSETPLHQTESLDYGVVLDGEVELELDSGQKRRLKRGDITVQRGTNHLWRNLSQNVPCRMMFVTLGTKNATGNRNWVSEKEGRSETSTLQTTRTVLGQKMQLCRRRKSQGSQMNREFSIGHGFEPAYSYMHAVQSYEPLSCCRVC